MTVVSLLRHQIYWIVLLPVSSWSILLWVDQKQSRRKPANPGSGVNHCHYCTILEFARLFNCTNQYTNLWLLLDIVAYPRKMCLATQLVEIRTTEGKCTKILVNHNCFVAHRCNRSTGQVQHRNACTDNQCSTIPCEAISLGKYSTLTEPRNILAHSRCVGVDAFHRETLRDTQFPRAHWLALQINCLYQRITAIGAKSLWRIEIMTHWSGTWVTEIIVLQGNACFLLV